MSTTNKRKRNSTKTAKKSNKKRKIDVDDEVLLLQSLPDELQIQILLHVPFEEIHPIRLVCSKWNKLTRTAIFGKQLCLNAYGENSAPFIITDLDSLYEAEDSELFLIPTHNGRVDWLKYFEIRYVRVAYQEFIFTKYRNMFRKFISSLKEKANEFTSSELSYLNILKLRSDRSTKYLTPLIFLLAPLLIEYKRKALAEELVGVLSLNEEDSFFSSNVINVAKLINGLLDMAELFPDLADDLRWDAFEKIPRFSFKAETICKGRKLPSYYVKVFKRLITAMIQQAADTSWSTFKKYFKVSSSTLKVIPDMNLKDVEVNFSDLLVPICIKVFENATASSIQACAIAASHVSDSNSAKYAEAKIEFALSVLQERIGHEQNVLRAAFFSIYIELNNKNLPKQSSFPALFQCLIQSLLDLPLHEKSYALKALLILMRSYSEYTERMLDTYHDNLFAVLKIPELMDRIGSNTLRYEMFQNILSICKLIKPHLSKYLDKYRIVLTKLVMLPKYASAWVAPDAWLALYIDILYLVTPNEAQKKVRQIESEIVYIGNVPIRKSHFFACCKSASKMSASTEEELIETVLKVFPKHFLDVIDPIAVSKDSDSLESKSSEELEEDNENALTEMQEFLMDHDGSPVTIEPFNNSEESIAPPDCVPYTQAQWDSAVSAVNSISSQSLQKLFTFKQPAAPKKSTTASFIKKVDMSTRRRAKPIFLIETTYAVDKIIVWAQQRDNAHEKFAQRFLHAINARMMCGAIESKHVKAVTALLEMLEPHLDDEHLVRYMTIVTQILAFGKLRLVSYSVYNKFIDTILLLVKKRVPALVEPEFLIAVLKLRCGPHKTFIYDDDDVGSVKLRRDCLNLLTSMYPRTAFRALQSHSLWPGDYFQYEDQVTIYKAWHLKLFGLKGLTELYGWHTELCVRDLQHLSSHFNAILAHDDIADFKNQLEKIKLYLELCLIDPDIGELNYHNQFLFDQHKLKNALIKANKYPGEMKYYSELMF